MMKDVLDFIVDILQEYPTDKTITVGELITIISRAQKLESYQIDGSLNNVEKDRLNNIDVDDWDDEDDFKYNGDIDE